MGTALYMFGVLLEALIEGHPAQRHGTTANGLRISRMTGHIIICGRGRWALRARGSVARARVVRTGLFNRNSGAHRRAGARATLPRHAVAPALSGVEDTQEVIYPGIFVTGTMMLVPPVEIYQQVFPHLIGGIAVLGFAVVGVVLPIFSSS
ncbi:hypothetical protein ACFVKB_16900 [Rhodococcus sp. NPDC127530]|uniref:hypothetical protein n=1 Tax=unclassified Rhodococcus (in: high G+C Gram-positive bacteria) TaxID=192944 RepID=UPI00362EAD39